MTSTTAPTVCVASLQSPIKTSASLATWGLHPEQVSMIRYFCAEARAPRVEGSHTAVIAHTQTWTSLTQNCQEISWWVRSSAEGVLVTKLEDTASSIVIAFSPSELAWPVEVSL